MRIIKEVRQAGKKGVAEIKTPADGKTPTLVVQMSGKALLVGVDRQHTTTLQPPCALLQAQVQTDPG